MPITEELIKEYKKDKTVYFETGTYFGQGVQKALDNGFDTVYSVEMSENHYKKCATKFSGNEKVILVHDSSERCLEQAVVDIKHPLNTERCFIYLDAHPMGGRGAPPLINELNIIASLKRNDHTIVVDDFRLIRDAQAWGTCFKGKDMKEEFNRLFLAINEDYQISYHGDAWDVEDLIVATLN